MKKYLLLLALAAALSGSSVLDPIRVQIGKHGVVLLVDAEPQTTTAMTVLVWRDSGESAWHEQRARALVRICKIASVLPDIPGADLQGYVGDESDSPAEIGGYYSDRQFWMPQPAWTLWLAAELSSKGQQA